MVIDFEVAESDIEQGDIRDKKTCPVAIALRRQLTWMGFPGAYVSVSNHCITLGVEDGKVLFAKPSKVMRQFISYFDAEMNEAVPFSARLRFNPPCQ